MKKDLETIVIQGKSKNKAYETNFTITTSKSRLSFDPILNNSLYTVSLGISSKIQLMGTLTDIYINLNKK